MTNERKLGKTTDPRHQRACSCGFERVGQLSRGQAVRLRKHTEGYTLALRQLITRIGVGDQAHHIRLQNQSLDCDADRVRPFFSQWNRAALREQAIVHQIKATALALHQPQVVKNPRQPFVSSTAGVEDVARRHTQR